MTFPSHDLPQPCLIDCARKAKQRSLPGYHVVQLPLHEAVALDHCASSRGASEGPVPCALICPSPAKGMQGTV